MIFNHDSAAVEASARNIRLLLLDVDGILDVLGEREFIVKPRPKNVPAQKYLVLHRYFSVFMASISLQSSY